MEQGSGPAGKDDREAGAWQAPEDNRPKNFLVATQSHVGFFNQL